MVKKTESIQWEIHKNELKLLAGMKVIEFGFQWRKKNTDYKGESFQWMKLKRIFSSSFLDKKKFIKATIRQWKKSCK